MELVLPATLEAIKGQEWPSPEEVTYWEARQNRTFYIDYEIDEDYMLIELGKIIIQMNIAEKDIDKKDLKPIYIFIHSFGGCLYQSNMFSDICIASRIPIVTVGMGACMSGGFLILLSGHKRYALKHCQCMVHEGGGAFQGTAQEIEEAQRNYKRQIEDMKAYILDRTTIDEKTFNKNKSKDWYLSSEELIKYHVIDGFVDNIEDIFN